jgi:hypothetical protein
MDAHDLHEALIRQAYWILLERSPLPAERALWLDAFSRGASLRDLRTDLLRTREFRLELARLGPAAAGAKPAESGQEGGPRNFFRTGG